MSVAATLPSVARSHAASPSSNTVEHGGPRRVSAARITALAEELDGKLTSAIERIRSLNTETKFIAINAKMEAMRAGGDAGKAFGVVAQAVQKVSNQTADVACRLAAETHDTVIELREINEILSTRVRGERWPTSPSRASILSTAISTSARAMFVGGPPTRASSRRVRSQPSHR